MQCRYFLRHPRRQRGAPEPGVKQRQGRASSCEVKLEPPPPCSPARDHAARVLQRAAPRTDPLTLARVQTPFRLLRHGVLLTYDARTLYAYVARTGDLLDPVCRGEYAAHELGRLARAAGGPRLDAAALRRQHQAEVERREMLRYLRDELLAATARREPTAHIISDLYTVASLDELLPLLREAARAEAEAEEDG